MRWEQIAWEWNKDVLGGQDLSYQAEEVGFLLATGSFKNPFPSKCEHSLQNRDPALLSLFVLSLHPLQETLLDPILYHLQANGSRYRHYQKAFLCFSGGG